MQEFKEMSMETKTATSKFPNVKKAIAEQVLVRIKKEIQKSRTGRVIVRVLSLKDNQPE